LAKFIKSFRSVNHLMASRQKGVTYFCPEYLSDSKVKSFVKAALIIKRNK